MDQPKASDAAPVATHRLTNAHEADRLRHQRLSFAHDYLRAALQSDTVRLGESDEARLKYVKCALRYADTLLAEATHNKLPS